MCIALRRTKNVDIRNLNVYRGGDSAILSEDCDGTLIDNVNIRTANDGLTLSESHNVTVTNCRIDPGHREYGRPIGGGDAIKVRDEERSSENITVQDCFLTSVANE